MAELSEADLHIYSELLATRIIAIRLWGFLAGMSGEPDYLARQCKQCIESLQMWTAQGPGSEAIKKRAEASIRAAFAGLVAGKPSGSRLQ